MLGLGVEEGGRHQTPQDSPEPGAGGVGHCHAQSPPQRRWAVSSLSRQTRAARPQGGAGFLPSHSGLSLVGFSPNLSFLSQTLV